MGVTAPARIGLGLVPTPLLPAPTLGAALGIDLWVKRDDLIGFASAGTKTRALELLVADALASGHDCFVGCGGPASNFCAGLVAAAARVGLPCYLVLYGSPPAPGRLQPSMVTFTGSPDRNAVEAEAALLATLLEREGRRPYVIPRGGSTAVGAGGSALAVAELDQPPARIVLAVGSGGTTAGMLAGVAAQGWPTIVTAAAVSRPVDETRARVLALAAACAERLGTAAPDPDQLEVHDAIGPGFGVASPESLAAAVLASRTEGLLLDETYTAKAMALLVRLAPTLQGRIVFWHTGGTVSHAS
ncbi:MAG TPA: pyridoxal-phosphate dependent enzyme [Acidimicrobiales bacterium]|nr:pyridoxal-phosphate dependent enzyme [Acidimicrobiales bacterium]